MTLQADVFDFLPKHWRLYSMDLLLRLGVFHHLLGSMEDGEALVMVCDRQLARVTRCFTDSGPRL
jgi:hypothetical protein